MPVEGMPEFVGEYVFVLDGGEPWNESDGVDPMVIGSPPTVRQRALTETDPQVSRYFV